MSDTDRPDPVGPTDAARNPPTSVGSVGVPGRGTEPPSDSYPVYVCFADKGEDPQGGGFVRADDEAEKLMWTGYFKAGGLKVTWTDQKGEVL